MNRFRVSASPARAKAMNFVRAIETYVNFPTCQIDSFRESGNFFLIPAGRLGRDEKWPQELPPKQLTKPHKMCARRESSKENGISR